MIKTAKNYRKTTINAVKDSIDVVQTIALLKAISYAQKDLIVFCKDTETFYRYEPTLMSGDTPDDTFLVSVNSDINARWKGVAGKYTYETGYKNFEGVKEIPAGLVNGSNTVFTLTTAPITGTAVVYVDGVAQKVSTYTLVSTTLTFTTAPALAQSVEVYYLKDTGSVVIVNTSNYTFLYHQVTAGEIIAKQLTLPVAPSIPGNTMVDVIGGVAQQYAIDFTITGTTFDWNGLGLDGVLVAGDYIRFSYFS